MPAVSLSDIGSAASIIALALTGWVAWEVRKIRNAYLLAARLPDLLQRLDVQKSAISDALNRYPASHNSALETLAEMQVTLESLAKRLPAVERKAAERVAMLVRAFRVHGQDDSGLRTIHLESL